MTPIVIGRRRKRASSHEIRAMRTKNEAAICMRAITHHPGASLRMRRDSSARRDAVLRLARAKLLPAPGSAPSRRMLNSRGIPHLGATLRSSAR